MSLCILSTVACDCAFPHDGISLASLDVPALSIADSRTWELEQTGSCKEEWGQARCRLGSSRRVAPNRRYPGQPELLSGPLPIDGWASVDWYPLQLGRVTLTVHRTGSAMSWNGRYRPVRSRVHHYRARWALDLGRHPHGGIHFPLSIMILVYINDNWT